MRFLCILLLAALPASAQTFSEATDVVVVEVPVQVIGADGKPVRRLTADNFEVYEGRKQQPLVGFQAHDLASRPAAGEKAAPPPVAARRHALTAGQALVGAEEMKQVQTAVLAAPFPVDNGPWYVPVLIEVDGPSLTAGMEGGAFGTDIYAYAFDAEGRVRDFFSQTVGLDLAKVGPALRQGDREVPYPFMVGAQPYVPASMPVLAAGQARLRPGALKAEAKVLTADGREAGAGTIEGFERLDPAPDGSDRMVASFAPPGGLKPGEYMLMITVTDSGGASETSVTPFRVAGG